MSEIDISIVISLLALFISTIHIVFDKWLDRWFERRDRNEIHEEFGQKVERTQKTLLEYLDRAELSKEEKLEYLEIVEKKFFSLIPILLNATYGVEKIKELEYEFDQFFFDIATKLGGRIVFKDKRKITEEANR